MTYLLPSPLPPLPKLSGLPALLLIQCRASQAEAELAEVRQQAEWEALRISELEHTSNVGQLMRRYEQEVQRLREQHDKERQALQQQLSQAQQQQVGAASQQQHTAAGAMAAGHHPSGPAESHVTPGSAAWAALFEEPWQQQQPEVQDAAMQTGGQEQQQQQPAWADPAILEAARLEIERLQELNEGLLESQSQGAVCFFACTVMVTLNWQAVGCIAGVLPLPTLHGTRFALHQLHAHICRFFTQLCCIPFW